MPDATVTDLRAPCLCGCGELPREGRRWIRGHPARGVGGYKGEPAASVPNPAIPTQDAARVMTDADWEALEGQGPPLPDPLAELYERERSEARVVEEIPPGPEGVSDDLRDAEPAHGQRDWARAAPGAAPPRVTQAIRREVAAKIGIPLAITGALYKLRDPWCGSVFEDIRKDLGAELADLACESPSVLAFFMGAGGRYMKYLNIGFTLLPWLEMLAAHHVLHTVGKDAQGQDAPAGPGGGPLQPPPPDFARYPA